MSKLFDVYSLVSSLSQTEKRYFKLFAQLQKTQSNYIVLFDILNNCKNFDEQIIHNKISKKNNATPVASVLTKLSQLILKSVVNYHNKNDIAAESIKFLISKGLYEEGVRLLKQKKKKAYINESYLELVTLLNSELILIEVMQLSKNTSEKIKAIQKEHLLFINHINEYANLRFIYTELIIFARMYGVIKNNSSLTKLNSIVSNELIYKNKKYDSVRNQAFYSQIMGLYYFIKQDYEQSRIFLQKTISIYEQYAFVALENPKQLSNMLGNLLLTLLFTKKLSHFKEYVKKFKSSVEQFPFSKTAKIDFQIKLYSLNLRYYWITKEFNIGLKLSLEIESWIMKNKSRLVSHYLEVLFLFIALQYFAVSDFNKALFWNNKNIYYKNTKLAFSEIFSFSSILNIIIHYELKNYILLESILNRNYQKERFSVLGNIVITHLRKILLLKNKKPKTIFNDLYNEVNNIQKNPFDKDIGYQYDFLIFWLENKLSDG